MTNKAVFSVLLSGLDDTYIGLNLGDGFCIDKLYAIPDPKCDEKDYQEYLFGDQQKMEAHRFLNWQCLTADRSHFYYARNIIHIDGCANDFINVFDSMLKQLDSKLRQIQLLVECPINYELATLVAFTKTGKRKNYMLPGNKLPRSVNISAQPITNIQKHLLEEAFLNNTPLPSELKPAFGFFIHSYFCSYPELAVFLLVSGLEHIFLNNEYGNKKIPLAKRTAIYLYPENETERQEVFNRVKAFYDLRSSYVHSAISSATLSDILILREYIRRSINSLSELTPFNKPEFINGLKKQIEALSWKED